MARKGKKRLATDLPNVLFDALLKSAQFRNITVTNWLIHAIIERLNEEKKYE